MDRTARITARVTGMAVALLFSALSATGAAAAGSCSQPVSSGVDPVVSDCLFILQTAVGQHDCSPDCICDLDGGGISSRDGLLCLQKAVGQDVTLACDCGLSTTTTVPSTTQMMTTTTVESPTTTLPFPFQLKIVGCVTWGVECRILTTSYGQVYSFTGAYVELGKCYEVTGTWQMAGYCMQGTQLSVSKIVESPYDCCAQ